MGGDKSLGLPHRLEPPDPPLSHSSRLMGLLSSIILTLPGAVDRLWNQLSVSDTLAA